MYQPYPLPVSVKGILFEAGKVWLRKNEREEWELPGGKLDEGEQPQQTVERELVEELGVQTQAIRLISADVYTIHKSIDESRGVFVVSYLCDFIKRVGDVEHIGEAGKAEFEQFSLDEVVVESFPMPQFYKSAIELAAKESGM